MLERSYQEEINTLNKLGYTILNEFYSDIEINNIIDCIDRAENSSSSFLQRSQLFAIRQLLTNIPQLKPLLFNDDLINLVTTFYQNTQFFVSKAIYFDKPNQSNWFVPYHQDLSISTDKKAEVAGYSHWTFKHGQHGVYPPLQILQDTITVRIHLDDTDENNGAVKVIPKSNLKGIISINSNQIELEDETICRVNQGGVMLLQPLTLHASSKNQNGKRRRVIHLEFNKHQLASPLNWLEYCEVK